MEPSHLAMRAAYIPKGALKVADKNSDAVAYLKNKTDTRTGKPYIHLVAFCGRRSKPNMNYRYSTEASAQRAMMDYFKERQGAFKYEQEQRAKRSTPTSLQVGTVLTGSWGYDQTNVEAWQVVEIVGKVTVKIRKVALHTTKATGDMSEMVIPCPDQFVDDKVLLKRVRDGNIVGHDYCALYVWDGKPQHQSHYA